MKVERWREIQQGELAYHEAKNAEHHLERKLPYWQDVIRALPDEIRFGHETRVLDLGCGSCSILLALPEGRLVGVDPLMERYLELSPFLAGRPDIRWQVGTAEELALDETFDVVFCVNAFDHVYDPRRVVAAIVEHLRPGGHCVLTMNTHNYRWLRSYYARLYRFIDPHHPYQLTRDDVLELFRALTPVVTMEIDELWFPHAERYRQEVLGARSQKSRKWRRAALNPLKWPIGLLKFAFDMPPHKSRPGQRSIYSDCLYVFRKDS